MGFSLADGPRVLRRAQLCTLFQKPKSVRLNDIARSRRCLHRPFYKLNVTVTRVPQATNHLYAYHSSTLLTKVSSSSAPNIRNNVPTHCGLILLRCLGTRYGGFSSRTILSRRSNATQKPNDSPAGPSPRRLARVELVTLLKAGKLSSSSAFQALLWTWTCSEALNKPIGALCHDTSTKVSLARSASIRRTT